MRHMIRLAHDAKGATAIEYGLIAALIAVAAIGAMSTLGSSLKTTFSTTALKMSSGVTAGTAA